MRFYQDEEKKTLTGVSCNCCGRALEMTGNHVSEGVLHVCKDWGYFSSRDLTRHEFDVCEECYDKMIRQFLVPVTETEILEV